MLNDVNKSTLNTVQENTFLKLRLKEVKRFVLLLKFGFDNCYYGIWKDYSFLTFLAFIPWFDLKFNFLVENIIKWYGENAKSILCLAFL